MSLLCIFCVVYVHFLCFFFKQKTAYEMRISDWSSDVCSSDLHGAADAAEHLCRPHVGGQRGAGGIRGSLYGGGHRVPAVRRDPGGSRRGPARLADRKSVV